MDDGSSSAAEIAALKEHNLYLEARIEEISHTNQSKKTEARLFAELASLTRRPPFLKTTRRNHVVDRIEFPEGCAYDPTINRPITYVTEELKAKIYSFGFASVDMDPQELMLHWFIMFNEQDLFSKLNLAPETLREFFRLVHNSYRANTYHNFQHAMDVAQFAFATYCSSSLLSKCFDEVDLFCCLILGLAHDMGELYKLIVAVFFKLS